MNYCDALLQQCKTLHDKRLLVEIESGQETTFGETLFRVQKTAAYLLEAGIKPGHTVAIHLYNTIDGAIMHMAIQYIGARTCFIDALVQSNALDYYLEVTKSQLLVTHLSRKQLPIEVQERTAIFEISRLASTINDIQITKAFPKPHDWPDNDVSYVYFTSGTTSTPKGVMLSQANHAAFTRICDKYWQPITAASKHLSYVPFSHGFGTIFLVPLALRTASELYIMRAFHPLRVLNAVENCCITHIYGVPSHYQQLLRLDGAGKRLRGIEMAFCAAAKLEHDVMLSWKDATGTVLCEGYGLIETCCGVVWRVGTPSLGTGHMGPCPDSTLVEIGIVDNDHHLLPPGKTGQIAVRGPSIMKGYLGNPEETMRVMHEGWFLSGDEGYVTDDGQLFMTGRIKDIINIAGIKVSPYEVEAVLLRHPDIEEAAAVAAPDVLYGEVVKAFVKTKTGSEVTEREIVRFTSERLINFQVPKSIVFVDSFPLNNMGKLDRKRLAEIISQ